jgi:hypothetical protein
MDEWDASFTRQMNEMQKGVHVPVKPRAWDDAILVPEARGNMWCNPNVVKPPEGHPEDQWFPVDVDARPVSQFNAELLMKVMQDHPDQQLRSFLWQGVDFGFGDKVARHHVRQSNLCTIAGLPDGFQNVNKELMKMADQGWYTVCEEDPYLFGRSLPQGGVVKVDNPLEPRRVAHGDAPTQDLWTTPCGEKVISNNKAVGMRDLVPLPGGRMVKYDALVMLTEADVQLMMQPTGGEHMCWPCEKKCSPKQLCSSLAVLRARSVVPCVPEPVYMVVSDFKKFFHQFRWCSWVVPFVGILWSTVIDKHKPAVMRWVQCLAVDMGVNISSNVAQRFSDLVLELFRTCMDEYEDNWWKHCKDEKMWEWRRVREKLGEVTGEREFRSYTAMVYTDDPCLAFCGLKHTREGLILWNDITSALNILMADPHKNQVSQSVKWCGMLFYSSFGVAMIPVSKKVRWQMDLQLAQQTAPVDSTQYRSMLGRTRHYLGVVGGATHQVPELMKGLWAPYYKGGHFRYKHSWKFKVPDGVRHSLAHIAEMAEQCPGVRWDMLITGGGSATVLTSDYHMYGDASGPEAE